jgi:hypothetical protein
MTAQPNLLSTSSALLQSDRKAQSQSALNDQSRADRVVQVHDLGGSTLLTSICVR